MTEGLSRVLSKQDFNSEAFVNKQTNGRLGNIDDLLLLRKQIGTLHDDTSVALKKNVYKHYSQFIETAKEISILEGEMYQLSHLLTEQKNIMTAMMEFSLTGSSKDEGDHREVNDSTSSMSTSSTNDTISGLLSLSYLLETVEGCSSVSDVPGRSLIHSGDFLELHPDTLTPIQKVHLFLLNDSLLVAFWLPQRKGPIKYSFGCIYELESLAVVNMKDSNLLRNAFKILLFPDTKIFSADNPKTKMKWLDILEVTKKNKMSQSRKSSHGTEVSGKILPKAKTSELTNRIDRKSLTNGSLDDKTKLEPLLNDAVWEPELWVRELPDDLDVCIAQREFKTATDLILKVTEYLDNCSKHGSIPEYRSRIEQRTKLLCEMLSKELQVSAERSIRGGPKATRLAVVQLVKLGKSILACDLFLKNRGAIYRHNLRQLKTESNTAVYVKCLGRSFFGSLANIAFEFKRVFLDNPGCYSAFVLWCRKEVQYLTELIASQIFATKANFSTIAECLAEAKSSCQKLSEVGLDLSFELDRLLGAEVSKLIQQAGDNQMDAIRHRAVDDKWKSVNYFSEGAINKMDEEMLSMGIRNFDKYTFDTYNSNITATTIQFVRSYRGFCCDLLRLYNTDLAKVVVGGVRDILKEHTQHIIKSAAQPQFRSQLYIIGQNAHFIQHSLIPWIIVHFSEVTGSQINELNGLFPLLEELYKGPTSSSNNLRL